MWCTVNECLTLHPLGSLPTGQEPRSATCRVLQRNWYQPFVGRPVTISSTSRLNHCACSSLGSNFSCGNLKRWNYTRQTRYHTILLSDCISTSSNWRTAKLAPYDDWLPPSLCLEDAFSFIRKSCVKMHDEVRSLLLCYWALYLAIYLSNQIFN
jgi:hypothetical protein